MKAIRTSIDQAPKAMPIWSAILEDLGNPAPHRIAKALGVARSTVYRWNLAGSGPRMACMALYWLTRWGRSEVDAQAANDATLYANLAEALARDRDRLSHQVELLTHALTPPKAATKPEVHFTSWDMCKRVSPVRQTGGVTSNLPPFPWVNPRGARSGQKGAGCDLVGMANEGRAAASGGPCAPGRARATAAAASTGQAANRSPAPTNAATARQKGRQGAQTAQEAPEQPRTRQTPPAPGHRSAGDQLPHRSAAARPAGAVPLLRGLNGPSPGARPQTPPPRAATAKEGEQ